MNDKSPIHFSIQEWSPRDEHASSLRRRWWARGPSSGVLLMALFALPQGPRVDFVELASQQRVDSLASTIWSDDFDRARVYFEPAAKSRGMRYSTKRRLGSQGRSMESLYRKGQRGIGGRKLVFGDAPFGKPVKATQHFDEIYWRYYVKYPRDWRGTGEAKQSRAIVFSNAHWAQASILHVWTSAAALTLDPVSAVEDGRVVSTKYNDFENFHWLGNAPKGKFAFYSAAELGRWVCVEVQWKLNTPGKADGVARLWVDGELDAERTKMKFRGSYTKNGINAVFLEAYWNKGSPRQQSRWIDNFVVASKPIGPIDVAPQPRVTPRLSPQATSWQLELVDHSTRQAVWRSQWTKAARSIVVSAEHGEFLAKSAKRRKLTAGRVYLCRLRERLQAEAEPGDWSPLHWPLRVGD